jgi:hypothetical protein
MKSLLTINNNVSLLSITIAPSTFLASLTLTFVFLYAYLLVHKPVFSFPLPRLPVNPFNWARTARSLPQRQTSRHCRLSPTTTTTATTTTTTTTATTEDEAVRPCSQPRPPPMMTTFDPLDHLDASLQDFELKTSPPPFGYPSHHSGFRSDLDTESEQGGADSVSAGGYSPPAWRRLGNGDRSSGFWRKTDNILGDILPHQLNSRQHRHHGGVRHHPFAPASRESSPEYESADEGKVGAADAEVLARAIQTRLPTGSMSPEKDFSPEPEGMADRLNNTTIKLEDFAMRELSPEVVSPRATPGPDNCK